MIAALVAGLLAGWAIAVPVGAIGAYLIGLSATSSLAVGAAAALGVATVDGAYAAVAVFGGRSLVGALGPIVTPLRVVSAVVLLAVAVRGGVLALAAYRRHLSGARTARAALRPSTAYLRLVGLTAVNPATVVYFVAIVLGSRTISELSVLGGLVFTVAAFAASASWQLTLAGGGAALGRVLAGPRGRLVTALGSSAVIATFAVILLATA